MQSVVLSSCEECAAVVPSSVVVRDDADHILGERVPLADLLSGMRARW